MGDQLRRFIKQTTPMPQAEETILSLMLASHIIRERISQVLASANITMGQYNILKILRGSDPVIGRTRGEISQRLVERNPDVTRMIDRIEALGYVSRVRNTTDRRTSSAVITELGLAVLAKLDGPMEDCLAKLTTDLSSEELVQLDRLCEKIFLPTKQPEISHLVFKDNLNGQLDRADSQAEVTE